MNDRYHVFPVGGPGLEHHTSGTWCWCDPEYKQLCVACFGRGCVTCQGSGFMPANEQDATAVIHNEEGAAIFNTNPVA